MAVQVGYQTTLPTSLNPATEVGSAYRVYVNESAPFFRMAMFDSLGIRYFWYSPTPTTVDAPTPAGTYDTSTLTILAEV